MKIALIVLSCILALVVAAFITRQLLTALGTGNPDLKRWLKDPDGKVADVTTFNAKFRLKVPEDLTDEEIEKMVDRLFVHDNATLSYERLELVGERAVPYLIKALEDPKTETMDFNDGSRIPPAWSPFERICHLLESIGPPEAARPLAKFVLHENDEFRKQAALNLGFIGSHETIDSILTALEDDDKYVRSYALMGIKRGMDDDRCSRDFLEAVFPAITHQLNVDDWSIPREASDLLLEIDTERSLPYLLVPEYFDVESQQTDQILGAMNKKDLKVPHRLLLPLIEQLKALDKEPSDGFTYAEALKAYANNPDASAEGLFRAELNSPAARVVQGAAEGLAILAGVSHGRDAVFDAVGKSDLHALPKPIQLYYAVDCYVGEVNNGGHAQYFFNSTAENWELTQEGLTAIGANAAARMHREACALFGPLGPSLDQEVRNGQLDRFSEKQDKVLEELDDQFYSSEENIYALLALYSAKNKEAFKSTE